MAVVWPIILGVFIAVIISFINKKTIGKLVDKLLSLPADKEENAVTLDELGLGKSSALKYALRPSSTLSKIVLKTSDNRYYIPEDKAYRAETTFSAYKVRIWTVVIAAVLLVAAGIGLSKLLPYIMELISAIG